MHGSGVPPVCAPPNKSKFFYFNMQIYQKVIASGIGTPSIRIGAPPTTHCVVPNKKYRSR